MNVFEAEADIAFFEECRKTEDRYSNVFEVMISDQICERAEEALKKQIPKKPIEYDDSGYEEYAKCECGQCLISTYGSRYSFCPKCGQAVDFSEVE